MATRLLLRIAPDGSLAWLAPATATRGGGVPPADLLAAAREVVVLVPGEDVLLARAALPKSGAAKLARVLPFALEDQVLDTVDELHFALGPIDDEGRHAVAAVSRQRLDGWLAALREAGVAADALLPDTLAVPLSGEAPALLLESQRCLVRLDATHGFTCEPAQLPAWLPPDAADVRFDAHVASEAGAASTPPGIDADLQPSQPALDTLANGLGETPAINLLQGDYQPRHRHAPQQRLWRIAAMLAVAALLLGLLGRVIDVVRLGHASRTADADIAALYAQSFPGAPPAPDPVARMRSELQRLGGSDQGGGLMPLLTRIAPLIVSQDSRLRVEGLEYRNGTLELVLHAPSLGVLDQLRERMATLPGLSAELTAATPGDSGIDGRLRIREGGA